MDNNKLTKVLLACNVVLLLGVVGIYILHFSGNRLQEGNPTPITSDSIVGVRVAYVDSDTLLEKYQYAIDLKKELEAYRDQQQHYYEQQVASFQADYQNYLKNGASMTLSQQQAKEEELKRRAEKISTLEQEVVAKVAERQLKENEKLLNAIFAYIREYNASHGQYDIVMRKTFNDSPTLYLNPAMDITNEIVDGLNEEYASLKK